MRRHTASIWMGTTAVFLLGACVAAESDRPFLGDDGRTGGTGGQTGASGTSSTASTGAGGSVPTACIPSESDASVDASCGVFVSSSLGDDVAGDGSKGAPFASLAVAIEHAMSADKPVYACAEKLTGAVAITAPVAIYGGLDCADGWAYVGSATKTTLTAAVDEVPLRLTAEASGTSLYDLTVQAADAVEAGGSSIAMIADGVTGMLLVRCDVVAGLGAAGLPGAAFPDSAPAAPNGKAGGDACSADLVVGGGSTQNACGASLGSIGGAGGAADQFSAAAGVAGQPVLVDNGGLGQGAASPCGAGTAGLDGATGAAGPGATGPGKLTATGYIGVAGGNGSLGELAQGGGGGGGSNGNLGPHHCSTAGLTGGASGGGGGAGGCGGSGGLGGMPGGSSIAIVSLGASLIFEHVTLRSADAGSGGAGGPGQQGGSGGLGGAGGLVPEVSPALTVSPGCNGGQGGKGGAGGQGGGGTGGHSLAIAFTGTAPNAEGATMTIGKAGVGGDGADVAGAGTPGTATPTLAF